MKKFTQKMIVGLSSLVLAFAAIVSTEGASHASSASAVVSRQSFETSGAVPGAQAMKPAAGGQPFGVSTDILLVQKQALVEEECPDRGRRWRRCVSGRPAGRR